MSSSSESSQKNENSQKIKKISIQDLNLQSASLINLIQGINQQLESEKQELIKEKENFEKTTKKLEVSQFPSAIKLNIGGQIFMTGLSTLKKDENSFFGVMFSGRWKAENSTDEAFFVDRDPTHFRYILNYLRTEEVTLPTKENAKTELLKEAEFYQLPEMVEVIKETFVIFHETTLLSLDHHKLLSGWLPASYQTNNWRLVFRASRDGFGCQSIPGNCRGLGATVAVIKSEDGFLFGGFLSVDWSSIPNGSYINDPNAFLFSLTNPQQKSFKATVKQPSNAFYFSQSLTVQLNWGSGDLTINGQQASSSLGSYYSSPLGATNSFTGSNNFRIVEMEIFVKK